MAVQDVMASIVGLTLDWLYLAAGVLIIYKLFAIVRDWGGVQKGARKAWRGMNTNRRDQWSDSDDREPEITPQSDTTGTIVADVINGLTRNPVPNARVYTLHQRRFRSNQENLRGSANNGRIKFEVEEGNYAVMARRRGFLNSEVEEVSVSAGETVHVELHMVPNVYVEIVDQPRIEGDELVIDIRAGVQDGR